MIVFAFAGQGSQRAGMGAELFARHARLVRTADAVLGYSVEDLCRAGGPRLNHTAFTQPALFVVNALLLAEAIERLGGAPDVVLGHSLGEFSALYAAGVFDFADGLALVARRGALMAAAGADGAMAALIGERQALLDHVAAAGPDIYLANDNAPRQIVIAGSRPALARFESDFRGRDLGDMLPLPVSGAFHSPLMAPAAEAFGAHLETQVLQPPTLPVIANRTAEPYQAAEIRRLLTEHLTRPVRWFDSIRALIRRGPLLIQDIDPGRVIAPLIRQIGAAPMPDPSAADP